MNWHQISRRFCFVSMFTRKQTHERTHYVYWQLMFFPCGYILCESRSTSMFTSSRLRVQQWPVIGRWLCQSTVRPHCAAFNGSHKSSAILQVIVVKYQCNNDGHLVTSFVAQARNKNAFMLKANTVMLLTITLIKQFLIILNKLAKYNVVIFHHCHHTST